MAVSKRLRFEILHRDDHTCRYCGGMSPDVKLTVDHVVPVALGGNDDPSNLVTACADCNAGKTSSNPDATLVADVAEDALRWSQAIQVAAADMLADHEHLTAQQDEFEAAWDRWGFGRGDERTLIPKDATWRTSIGQFLAAGLPMPVLLSCVELVMSRDRVKPDDKFRYFCGVAWGKIREIREHAGALVNGHTASPVDDDAVDQFDEGRAAVAADLLADLDEDERARSRAAIERMYTDPDDQPDPIELDVDTVREAMCDRAIHRHLLMEALNGIQEGFPAEQVEQARRLAIEDLTEYGSDQPLEVDVLAASGRYLSHFATVNALPEGEREFWRRYAAAAGLKGLHPEFCISDLARRYRDGLTTCVRGMCQAIEPENFAHRCMEHASFSLTIENCGYCADAGRSSCNGDHVACHRHLEQMIAGGYSTKYGPVVIADFTSLEVADAT